MSESGPLDPLGPVVAALTALGVDYMVCGSLASSLYGEPRSTHDIDLVVELDPRLVQPLIARLGSEFYADADAIRSALGARMSFNVIHQPTGTKIDCFPRRERRFSRIELARARTMRIADRLMARIASAEDTLLTKLEWYSKGGCVSDRQWRDVLGILKTQGAKLDRSHLEGWATELGLRELLDRALREAGAAP